MDELVLMIAAQLEIKEQAKKRRCNTKQKIKKPSFILFMDIIEYASSYGCLPL